MNQFGIGGGKGVGAEIPHSAGPRARFSILSLLFIHVSITIKIKLEPLALLPFPVLPKPLGEAGCILCGELFQGHDIR